MMLNLTEFQKAIPILEKVNSAGFEAYFVGGAVRDALLGRPINDIDIATSAYPEEVKSIFPKTVDLGIEHGTVMVIYKGEGYELTTYRTESDYTDYRRPDRVEFVKSLEEDLKRRDFTINALAIDEEGNIVDYFQGVDDLKKGLIRAVGLATDRFREDALRMMRAVRFVGQLDFHLEEGTAQAISELHQLLEHIAVERIEVEFTKLLMGKAWKNGFQAWIDTGLSRVSPGLSEKNQENLQAMANQVHGNFENPDQAWAILMYYLDFEKEQANHFMRTWKQSNARRQDSITILRGIRHRLDNAWLPLEVYDYGTEKAYLVESALDLIGQPSDLEGLNKIVKELPIFSVKDLAITGKDLMVAIDREPGPWMGEWLRHLQEAVVNHQLVNDKEKLLAYSKEKL